MVTGILKQCNNKGEGTHEPKAQMVGAYPVVSLVWRIPRSINCYSPLDGMLVHCRVRIPLPPPPCRVCHWYLFIQLGEERQSGVKANPNPKPRKQHSGQGLNPGTQDPEFKELTTYTPPHSKTKFKWKIYLNKSNFYCDKYPDSSGFQTQLWRVFKWKQTTWSCLLVWRSWVT